MKKLYTLALLIFTIPCFAKLIIVEDKGGSSAIPYYQSLGIIEESNSLPNNPPIDLSPQDDSVMLPVISERLSVGKVSPRTINLPGMLPIFLIGDDSVSVRWLKQRQTTLVELGAVGLIVNIDSPENLHKLRQLVPTLTLMPVSADDLAMRLQLSHYPVLITATGIEQ